MRMSTAKEGRNPAIIPSIKYQIASIVVCPVWIEYCLADLVTGITEPILLQCANDLIQFVSPRVCLLFMAFSREDQRADRPTGQHDDPSRLASWQIS